MNANPYRSSPLGRIPVSFVVFVLLLAAYDRTFGAYFPNVHGTIGNDYSYVLPNLLAGHFWRLKNGIFAVPWFTPAVCGGLPFLPDPQSHYYSVAQGLMLLLNPLAAVYCTILLFASAGYWGMYLFMRRSLGAKPVAAMAAAAVFMWNGFFSARMLAGHFLFSGFMLVPWLAWLLGEPAPDEAKCVLRDMDRTVAASVLIAYWLLSGLGAMGPVSVLTVALLLAVKVAVVPTSRWRSIILHSALALVIAGLLSAAKAVASWSFMEAFPRSDYLIPGFRGVAAALRSLVSMLFFDPVSAAEQARARLVNLQWAVTRHELEYGVTWVPLATIALGATFFFLKRFRITVGAMVPRQWLALGLVGFGLGAVLLINVHSPAWNSVLKALPMLRSTSSFLRWLAPFVVLAAVATGLAVDVLPGRLAVLVAAIGIVAMVLTVALQDRAYYDGQDYDPTQIVAAREAVLSASDVPSIQSIGVYRHDGQALRARNTNDLFVKGQSQLLCYNPLFGYLLERFPIRDLHPGSIEDVRDGHFNLKNPACYVYPNENRCRPGDHFTVDQAAAMAAFADYRPYPFEVSRAQRIANWLSLLSWGAAIVILAASTFRRVRKRRSAARTPAVQAPTV